MSNTHINIENIQKEVKTTINELLFENGYSLVKEEKLEVNLDLLLLWFNKEKNHTIQLRWDLREHWFTLQEYSQLSDLKYAVSSDIDLFPFRGFGVVFRRRYNAKYVLKIKLKIQEILGAIKDKDFNG